MLVWLARRCCCCCGGGAAGLRLLDLQAVLDAGLADDDAARLLHGGGDAAAVVLLLRGGSVESDRVSGEKQRRSCAAQRRLGARATNVGLHRSAGYCHCAPPYIRSQPQSLAAAFGGLASTSFEREKGEKRAQSQSIWLQLLSLLSSHRETGQAFSTSCMICSSTKLLNRGLPQHKSPSSAAWRTRAAIACARQRMRAHSVCRRGLRRLDPALSRACRRPVAHTHTHTHTDKERKLLHPHTRNTLYT